MPITYDVAAGGALVDASGTRLPRVKLSIQLPDAFPGNVTVAGVVQGVGPQGGAAAGTLLAEQSVAASLALPAVPTLGTTFYVVVVDVTTGAATLSSSPTGYPAAAYPNQVLAARGAVRAGQVRPETNLFQVVRPAPVPASAPPAVTQTAFNPVDFGADPSGAQDSTPAVQAAIAAAASVGTPAAPGAVLFPDTPANPGTYKIRILACNSWTVDLGGYYDPLTGLTAAWDGGNFRLGFGGFTTGSLSLSASSATIAAAINGLSPAYAGKFSVSAIRPSSFIPGGTAFTVAQADGTLTATGMGLYVYPYGAGFSLTQAGNAAAQPTSNFKLIDGTGVGTRVSLTIASNVLIKGVYAPVTGVKQLAQPPAWYTTLKLDDYQGQYLAVWLMTVGTPINNFTLEGIKLDVNRAKNPCDPATGAALPPDHHRYPFSFVEGGDGNRILNCHITGADTFFVWHVFTYPPAGGGDAFTATALNTNWTIRGNLVDDQGSDYAGGTDHDHSGLLFYGVGLTAANNRMLGNTTRGGLFAGFELGGRDIVFRDNYLLDYTIAGHMIGRGDWGRNIKVLSNTFDTVCCGPRLIPFIDVVYSPADGGQSGRAPAAGWAVSDNLVVLNQQLLNVTAAFPRAFEAGPTAEFIHGVELFSNNAIFIAGDGVLYDGLAVTGNTIRNDGPVAPGYFTSPYGGALLPPCPIMGVAPDVWYNLVAPTIKGFVCTGNVALGWPASPGRAPLLQFSWGTNPATLTPLAVIANNVAS